MEQETIYILDGFIDKDHEFTDDVPEKFNDSEYDSNDENDIDMSDDSGSEYEVSESETELANHSRTGRKS